MMEEGWGFWKERMVAFYLVFLAAAAPGLCHMLVVFGDEIEAWMQNETLHIFRPVVLLFWISAAGPSPF